MGAGRYNTNKRVNTATSAAAKQRAAALASGPAYPVVSDPVVNLPVKFASLASPFDAGSDPFAVEQVPERFTYQTGDVLPEGYRSPAKLFSNMTSDEQRANLELARLAETGERTPTTASFSQGLQVQDFGAQPKFGSPDEALANYGNVFNTLKGQEEQVNKVYNYNNFDPGDFGRTSVSLREGNRAAGTGLAEYVQQNEIPLSKVIDGERKYLTTGNPQANAELWPNAFQGGDLVATGPAGTYSTTFQKDKNLLAQVASDPILGIAANFIPGGTLALTAAKAASGESLSPADIVTLAVPALNKAGMLTAPQAAVSAADAVDGIAKAAVEGVGIAGLGYNNSVALINAAATGDPTSVVTSLVGNAAIDKAFSNLSKEIVGPTLDGEPIRAINYARIGGLFQADDLKTGLTKVVEKVASGEKFDDALLAGLGTYVKEGGTLRLPTPEGFDLDVDLGVIEDVVKAAVRPIEGIVREAGRVIDDNVLQPVKEVGEEIGETLEPIVETVKEAGSTIDDTILQPVKETVETGASVAGDVLSVVDDEVIQPVIQGVEEGASVAGDVLSAADTVVRDAASAFDDAVIQPIGDAFSDLDTAVRQALPDINGPDIDLPDINLPDINLPDFNLPSFTLGNMGDMGMMMGLMTPQANATTNKLFENELFKFKTEVGITDREELIDIEDFLTSSFSSSFDQQQRF